MACNGKRTIYFRAACQDDPLKSWRDDRLKWDKRQYENVSSVHISPDRVWKADIMTYNSVEHEDYTSSTDVVVANTGTVFWVPPVTFHTSCDFDLTYWPWDAQQCRLIIGSWTRTGSEIDLINNDRKNVSKVDTNNFSPVSVKTYT